MLDKAWLQGHEVAGHIASTVRKQRERDAGTQLISSILFHPGTSAYGMVPPTFHKHLPSLIWYSPLCAVKPLVNKESVLGLLRE